MGRPIPDHRVDLGIAGLVLAATYAVAAMVLGGPEAFPALAAPFLVTGAASLWTLWSRGGRLGLLETAWPLVLWPFLYQGAVEVLGHVPFSLDPALARMDQALIGPLDWRLGGPAEELANAVYMSYYVLIPAGFLWLWRTGRRAEAAAYTSAVLTAFVACALVWLVVPAGGPHAGGAPGGEPFGPFTAAMRWVYAVNPHQVAALPSSHVALATAATVVAVRSGAPRVGLLWPLAIGWATIFGQYHFAVDTPPALVVGVLSASLSMRLRDSNVAWAQTIVIREP